MIESRDHLNSRTFKDTNSSMSLPLTYEMMEMILDGIPDVIGIQDLHHNVLKYNKAGLQFLNLPEDSQRFKKCYEYIGRDIPCEVCATSIVYRTKKPAQVEKFVPELNIWLDVRAYPIFDSQGIFTYVIEHLRDITARKKTDAALELRVNFERLLSDISRRFIDVHPDEIDGAVVEALERTAGFLNVNRACIFIISEDSRLFERKFNWVQGAETLPCAETIALKDIPVLMTYFQQSRPVKIVDVQALTGDMDHEVELMNQCAFRSALIIPLHYAGILFGILVFFVQKEPRTWLDEDSSMGCLIGETVVNALVHKRAEQRIRDSEQQYRNLYDNALVGMFRTRMSDGKLLKINASTAKIFGFESVEDVMRHDLRMGDYYNPERRRVFLDELQKHGEVTDFEIRVHHPRGGTHDVVTSARLFPQEGFIEGVVQDITSEKRMRDQMQALRKRLKNIIDSMPSMLMGIDHEGRVTDWNREAQKVTGISPDNALGRNLQEIFPVLTKEFQTVRDAIMTREIRREKSLLKMLNNKPRFVDLTIYPLMSNGSEGAVIRLDDVTDRVRIEEMMIQSEKMVSIGGLAAGMAHEINNPLAGILQNAQVLRSRLFETSIRNTAAADEIGISFDSILHYMEQRHILPIVQAIIESGSRRRIL